MYNDMKFEYNANLQFQERIEQVKKEILEEYPLISEDYALLAASLSSTIDDKSTNDDKFDRYYYLLKIIGKENEEFSHVFNDLFNLYQKGFKKNINNLLTISIIDYITGSRKKFPELFEYYS